MLVPSILALVLIGELGSSVAPEPATPRDEFEPIAIAAVELPVPIVEPTRPIVEPIEIVEPPPIEAPPTRCIADRRCRAMRISGISVGVLGLAAIGTGVGLVLAPDRVLAATPAYVTSTRPPGLVTLTLGVGVTLTAVLVLVASRSGSRDREGRHARLDGLGLHF